MRRWLLSEIRAKILNDLDLSDEVFISAAEMTGYINEAIDAAEQEIVKLADDYFLTYEPLALVAGTSVYALPATIYAQKIRGVMYRNGSIVYTMRRIRDGKKPQETAEITAFGEADDYKYALTLVDATGVQQLEIFPASRETSAANVRIWFDRNSNQLSSESDECDLPEAMNFIFAHVKKSCLTKEFLGQPPQAAIDEVKIQRQLLADTLSERVVDNDNEIEADFTHYREHQ